MNKLVFVALLLVAACAKKGADCEPAITKSMDTMTANIKERAPNPQILEKMMGMLDKVKSTMIERCKQDNWSADMLSCISSAGTQKDMQGCQEKLPPDQKAKLKAELTQVMMSAMGGGMRPGAMGAMPPDHPAALAPNTSPTTPGDQPAPGAAAGSAAPAAGAPAGGGSAAAPPAAGGAAADGSGSGKTGW